MAVSVPIVRFIRADARSAIADELLNALRAAANAKDRPLAEQKPLIPKAVSHVLSSDTTYQLRLDCSLSELG